MKLSSLLIAALIAVSIAGAAFADRNCRIRQDRPGSTSVRAREGKLVCLSGGKTLRIISLSRSVVRLRVGRSIREVNLKRHQRHIEVGDVSIDLNGISRDDDALYIRLVIFEAEPDPGLPRACPIVEGGICIQLFEPVCGRDPSGEIKFYTNDCYAALDCAERVEDELCGI